LLRWRTDEGGKRLRGLSLGLGRVDRLACRGGNAAIPEQLVLRFAGPSRVPARTTVHDAVGSVAAVARDTLWLALDEFTAARDVV
jgi:hypothetical protein